jgi:hypothetical protein
MKMREDEVVSSSVSLMQPSTSHGSASVAKRCAKNLATLRSLLVSRRWMREYWRSKQSAKQTAYSRRSLAKRSPSRG